MFRAGSLLRAGEELVQRRDQRWQIALRGVPQNAIADTEILVHNQIPHGTHLGPSDLRMASDDVIWDASGWCADDNQVSDNGVNGASVSREGREVMPSTYSRMAPVAWRMSVMRNLQSLGGIDGLVQNPLSQRLVECIRGHKIHSTIE